MAREVTLVVYPVTDLGAATSFYRTFLDVEPYVESPYYVGFRPSDDQEIGLDPNSSTGPIAYANVDDITRALAEMTGVGAEIVQAPSDVGGGLLIAQVKDVDGNVVGFRQFP